MCEFADELDCETERFAHLAREAEHSRSIDFLFHLFGFWLMSYVLRNYFDMSPKDVGHLLMHPWMATLSLGFILSPLLVEKTSLWPWKLLGWCGSLVGALFAYSTVVSLLKS